MGLRWHLVDTMAREGLSFDALELRLGFSLGHELRGAVPPIDLSLPIVADLCQAIGCQPGDLLSWLPDDPAEQAERALAQDALFQSFLAYRHGQLPSEPDGDG
ncbi:MAG: helix-turn-helix domain-containing protein [Candidatus Sericytochromatia bacterium]|nr:helix-turn-helix domain-containing protein [Candidatus Sericytochromatia bacterium]